MVVMPVAGAVHTLEPGAAAAAMNFSDSVEWVGKGIEAAGVATVVVGALLATLLFLRHQPAGQELLRYRLYRERLGRVILLALEFLVAGDIIRTVAIQPTFTTVGVLAAIVAIRSFLSMELEMEIEGRWPWQRGSDAVQRAGQVDVERQRAQADGRTPNDGPYAQTGGRG
jgi:uncharacterized membrane protein